MKTIILITNSFPFGIVEKSFIAPELKILSRKFKIVIISRNVKDEVICELPENVTVYRYDSKNGYSLFITKGFICRNC